MFLAESMILDFLKIDIAENGRWTKIQTSEFLELSLSDFDWCAFSVLNFHYRWKISRWFSIYYPEFNYEFIVWNHALSLKLEWSEITMDI